MAEIGAFLAVETTARNAYGRLLAFLVRRSGDIAGAEDALAEAFARALEDWPRNGVPQRPEAWLLQTAKRKLIDAQRRAVTRDAALPGLVAAARQAEMQASDGDGFPDERLGMLFACAHPAIAVELHAPLMLQIVLGVDAARIASAFLVAPAAMRQRLVRVKTKIRQTAIDIEVPDVRELPQRIQAVLDAVYLAYGLAWDEVGGTSTTALRSEAIFIARMLQRMLQHEPEVHGLLALLLFLDARENARFDEQGEYVPLDAQDPSRWSLPQIEEAERTLRRAGTQAIGRFQIEAAIQSAHVQRAFERDVDAESLALLYDALVARSPALGAKLARIAAHARAYGNAAGLTLLQELDVVAFIGHQPYWALRAHLTGDAHDYDHAAGLTEHAATRRFLLNKKRLHEGF